MTLRFLLGWTCPGCGRSWDRAGDPRACPCGALPEARYDLEAASRWWRCERPAALDLAGLAPLLPLAEPEAPRTLGAGGTPLVPLPGLASAWGLGRLWVKREGANPTSSFKARGLAMALHAARRAGAREVAVATAGNAGGACAAFAAANGLRAHVFAPEATSEVTLREIRAHGAELHLLAGDISHAYEALHAALADNAWRDVSVSCEPHRIEAKRTMAFELAAAFEEAEAALPQWIVLPTGGGVAVVAHHKALRELEGMGALSDSAPRLVAAQAASCAPLARAVEAGSAEAKPWEDPAPTLAEGVRVPRSGLHTRVLEAVRDTGGTAASVEEEEIVGRMRECARRAGILLSPEGAVAAAVTAALARSGVIPSESSVLFYDTASIHKYPDALYASI